jgi:hypothetical protein
VIDLVNISIKVHRIKCPKTARVDEMKFFNSIQ